MQTRSVKLKRKMRGRPCDEGVARTDNGRKSRAQDADTQDAPDKVAREARMRLHRVSKEDASQPEAGTVIGRLKLTGQISPEQYEALMRYQMTRERYFLSIGAPDSLKNGRGGGVMSIPSDERDEGAKNAWHGVRNRLLADQQMLNCNMFAALQYIVIQNEEHFHMFGDLRMAANCLARYYGVVGKSKVA